MAPMQVSHCWVAGEPEPKDGTELQGGRDECMGVNWEGDELEAPDLQKGRVRGRLQEEL